MQTDYDDYDDAENPSMRWMSIVVLLLAVAGFFSLAWYAYYTGTKSVQTGDVVVIEADSSPIKEAPEDPGGMEFPHQEKTIYQAVNPDAKPSGDTVVLDSEEEVVLPEDMDKEPTAADEKIAAILQNAANETQQANKPVVAKEVPKVTPPAVEAPKEQPKPVEAPKLAPLAQPSPAAPKAAPASASMSGYKIQLGAFRSQGEAEQTWNKVRAAHSVLSGKAHEIIRADLGAKGVYYRLRVGGYASDDAAKSACAALSAQNQGCFPVGK